MCHRRVVRTSTGPVRAALAPLLAAVLLVAGACGGGGSKDDAARTTTTAKAGATTAPAPDGPQACDLLTTAQLQSALHRDFSVGSSVASPSYGTGCTWGTTAGEPPVFVSIVVATDEQLQVALGRVAKALYEQTRDGAQVDENLPLGDSAYRAGPQVVVLDHGVLLSLAVTDTAPASVAGIRTLAAAAVEALAR
jgi:hypothetical protein